MILINPPLLYFGMEWVSFYFFFLIPKNLFNKINISPNLFDFQGDSCCFSFSLGAIKRILEEELPGVYVKSIRIGNDVVEVN